MSSITHPKVTVHEVSRVKISNNEGYDSSHIVFSFDEPVMEYKVKVNGDSTSTGVEVQSESKYISDLKLIKVSELMQQSVRKARLIEGSINAKISSNHLEYEGDNQINIYGRNIDGEWTPYMDE